MISKEQVEFVTLYIEGEKMTDIARKLNRDRSTVYGWLSKDDIKAEIEKRRQEIVHQGNNYILRDYYSYIDNIKELANDKSDKRVCLAANQYLINRIVGNPTQSVEVSEIESADSLNENDLEKELNKFKGLKIAK